MKKRTDYYIIVNDIAGVSPTGFTEGCVYMNLNLFTALAAQTTPDMGFAGLVTVTGMTIVFLVLIALVLIFNVFGRIMAKGTGKEKKEKPVKSAKAAPAAAPAVQAPAAPAAQANGVAPEIVAAIAAALAQYGENGVIRSVRPVMRRSGRNPWAVAGIMENTRQF